jgi:ABC-type Mn2+/Zn2+ transport system ATPase subunit
MPVLSLTNVVAYRRGDPLFSQATFELELGDCMMLSAGNGTGKTTLLDCVADLYHDWSGAIHRPRGQISYLQQTSQYVRTLPLSRVARLVDGFEEKRYQELLTMLDLCSKSDEILALLSGGELQRARLLLTLLRRHRLLLLDEPFANVDPTSCRAIVTQLEKTRSVRAALIVTHPRDAHNIVIQGSMRYELRRSQC